MTNGVDCLVRIGKENQREILVWSQEQRENLEDLFL
jgi:hypothetical protein